jgi:hypothetical protein
MVVPSLPIALPILNGMVSGMDDSNKIIDRGSRKSQEVRLRYLVYVFSGNVALYSPSTAT